MKPWPDAGTVMGTEDSVAALRVRPTDAARADILVFTTFAQDLWTQTWSNNPGERLSREIRRLTTHAKYHHAWRWHIATAKMDGYVSKKVMEKGRWATAAVIGCTSETCFAYYNRYDK